MIDLMMVTAVALVPTIQSMMMIRGDKLRLSHLLSQYQNSSGVDSHCFWHQTAHYLHIEEQDGSSSCCQHVNQLPLMLPWLHGGAHRAAKQVISPAL